MARQFAARSLLAAPIVHQGGWLGVVGLHQCDEPRSWEEDEVSLVKAIAQQMAVAISHAQLYEQLQEQAVRDGLTGLFNRRYFDQALRREIERAERYGHLLSLAMVDLDYLKRINDELGHQAGDAAIREVGQVLATKSRRTDVAARYGGEEFAVILVETPLAGAQAAAEAWRREITQRVIAEGRKLSASIGLASYPLHATTAEDLIKAADLALYRAKREGRNRVCVADE
jgi:diguanylate cyclase (GGDEF)-like protein